MFRFKLVALTGVKFDDDVYEVILPTLDGQIGVLAHHMPLVSVAKPGIVMIRKNARDTDNQREYFAISGGAIDVSDNTLRLLADEADTADEINESEATAAHDRAKKMLAEAKDQVSLDHAQQLVDRHAVRLQVANLKRRQKR